MKLKEDKVFKLLKKKTKFVINRETDRYSINIKKFILFDLTDIMLRHARIINIVFDVKDEKLISYSYSYLVTATKKEINDYCINTLHYVDTKKIEHISYNKIVFKWKNFIRGYYRINFEIRSYLDYKGKTFIPRQVLKQQLADEKENLIKAYGASISNNS